MKAKSIHYTRNGHIELIQHDLAPLGDHQVALKGLYCGICSWDIATCRFGDKMPLPAPAGHEGVSVVEAVGSKVSGIQPGELYAFGGFHTRMQTSPAELEGKRLPDAAEDLAAWVVEPVSCCVTAMDTSPLRAGDKVAVVGCGFMGQVILQLLAQSFAAEVHAFDVIEERLQLAKSQWPRVMTHSIQEAESRFDNAFDIVYDTSGAQAGLDTAVTMTRPCGHVNLFGWLKGTEARFDPSAWHLKGITVCNSSPAGQLRDPFPPAIRLMENRMVQLRPLITHEVSMEEYPALMQSILNGDPHYVKGVVTLVE
jgi:threonine dehydrogenase-like Zn-dependent dehydrogenase